MHILTTPWGKRVAVRTKAKYTCTLSPSDSTPGVQLEIWNTLSCPPKDRHKNAHDHPNPENNLNVHQQQDR